MLEAAVCWVLEWRSESSFAQFQKGDYWCLLKVGHNSEVKVEVALTVCEMLGSL